MATSTLTVRFKAVRRGFGEDDTIADWHYSNRDKATGAQADALLREKNFEGMRNVIGCIWKKNWTVIVQGDEW